MSVVIDEAVPGTIRVPATGATEIALEDYRGKWIVLYCYPKDATPGCTDESRDFSARLQDFVDLNAVVLGVSRDSVASHERFRERQELPFDLLSDGEEKLCQAFDVMRTKNMYGKQVRGIERSTFLIDPDGVLRREWRKVKVPGHVDTVLENLRALAEGV